MRISSKTVPTVHIAPVSPKRDTKHVVGKQAMIGLDIDFNRNGGFRNPKTLKKPYSHPWSGSMPPGSGSATRSRRITAMRQKAASRSFLVPMAQMRQDQSWAGLPVTRVLGMIRGGVVQWWCVRFICCMMVHAHTLLCGECRCDRVLRIGLVLNKISIPLISKGLRNRLLALALEAYISITLLHIPYFLSRHLYKAQP